MNDYYFLATYVNVFIYYFDHLERCVQSNSEAIKCCLDRNLCGYYFIYGWRPRILISFFFINLQFPANDEPSCMMVPLSNRLNYEVI